jgi:uncharacterized membrane protein YphA (DoxX/SURF4 family)
MTIRMKRTIVETTCAMFILLFVYAALSKLLDYERFHMQLGQSPLLTSVANLVAWLIPTAEIIISLLLISSRWQLTGLYASFGMMVMFTAYIVAITHFSEYIPCSCGGILEHMSWNQHLAFNILFVLLAVSGILTNSTLEYKKRK